MKLLPTISTRQPSQVRQYESTKSNEMDSLTVFRKESSLFFPRECRRLPPVMAWSTPLITMDKTGARRDMLCPYSKIKLTKLSLNTLLDKIPPPHFYDIYLIINIHTYTILSKFIYLDTFFITMQNPYQ